MTATQLYPRRTEPPLMSFYPGDVAARAADAVHVDANMRAGRTNPTVDLLRALLVDSVAPARRWEIATWFHRVDDSRATMSDLHRTRTAYEAAGYEVTIRTDDGDPDRLNVWIRPALAVSPAPRWTPERIAEYEALFEDGDGLTQLAAQERAVNGESA